MRILLTGASGFLGSVIKENNENILTVGRKKGDIICDLSKEVPKIKPVDIVIHAASKVHSIPRTDSDKSEFWNVNVLGSENLLAALSNIPTLKSFVFISSVSVYGIDEGVLITEDCKLSASDPYGKSKVAAEKLISEWCKSRNIICTILRLPLLIGTNAPGNLNNMIQGIKLGYYFNIAGGQAKKSMVLASDVAKYILPASRIGGTYNLTDGYHPNFKELSNLIANELGKKGVFNLPYWMANILAKIGDISSPQFPINSQKLKKIMSTLTFNDTKAREAFGWNPISVLEGFKLSSDEILG